MSRKQRDDRYYTREERARMEMRARRVAARRRRENKKRLLIAVGIVLFIFMIWGGISALRGHSHDSIEAKQSETGFDAQAADSEYRERLDGADDRLAAAADGTGQTGDDGMQGTALPANTEPVDSAAYRFEVTEATKALGSEEVTSTYALVADRTDHHIVAQKNATDRINPASMTKVLTLLVAAEHITNLDDTFTMTIEITDYAYVHDCSSVGFLDGEIVTVRDLLYGTILPSGGDAAVGLATYVAGSQEAFVELMNQKIADLGLSGSAHFTNCVGLYDENHYCSIYDMAVMMEAAMQNELCREILNARKYKTSATEQHPEGIDISNLFMRRIEDKDTGGEVLGAKTGYVVQSGNCAVSAYRCNDGKEYICVTADAHSSWRAIYDHVAAYNIYAAGNTGYTKQ